MDNYTDKLHEIASGLLQQMQDSAAEIEAAGGPNQAAAYADILRTVRTMHKTAGSPGALDGRTTAWRVRLQIFGPDGSLEADSDADNGDIQAPGETIIHGVKPVADWAAAAALAFHAERGETVTSGLDQSLLYHKINSLRPTLSRNGGKATWRIPYVVGENEKWLVYIPIARQETAMA